MENKDAKPRFIRSVILLQEFDFELKDRKGTKNHVADHLSILEDEATRLLGEKAEIDDTFPYEHALSYIHDLIPWFPDFANYLVSDIVSSNMSFQQRKKFMHDVKMSFWDEPYLYQSCFDGLLHFCMSEV